MVQPTAHAVVTNHEQRSTIHHVAPNIAVRLAARSWQGSTRSNNRDQYLAASIRTSLDIRHSSLSSLTGSEEDFDSALLLSVADGIAGRPHGEPAGSEAMHGLVDYVRRALRAGAMRSQGTRPPYMDSTAGARQMLEGAISESELRTETAAQPPRSRTATTLSAALLLWPYLYLAHVGDSRCQLLRDGEILSLTAGHSVAEGPAAERLDDVVDGSPYHHVLRKALRFGAETEQKAELHRAELRLGDVLLLSSDGLGKWLRPDELVDVALAARGAPDRCISKLDRRVQQRAPSDDTTIVIASVAAL